MRIGITMHLIVLLFLMLGAGHQKDCATGPEASQEQLNRPGATYLTTTKGDGFRINWKDAQHQGVESIEIDRLTGAAEAAVRRASKMASLVVLDSRLNDTQLIRLLDSLTLECLDIQGGGITDESLAPIAKVSNLRELTIRRTKINGERLGLLEGLSDLETLNLSENDLSRANLSFLGKLPNLRQFHAENCSIGDEQVMALERAGHLQVLWLAKNPLSDSAAESLVKLQELIMLDVSETRVSEKVYGTLRQEMPNAFVLWGTTNAKESSDSEGH